MSRPHLCPTARLFRGRLLLGLVLLALLGAGCGGLVSSSGSGLASSTPSPTAPVSRPPSGPARASAAPTGALSLLVEPDAGMGPVYTLLGSPTHTLDLVMYELVDQSAESVLASDAARGVRVRVLLDRNREGRANSPAYAFLAAHGVSVAWAPAGFDATHEKAAVVDAGLPDATALIMSLNLTSRYYTDTRDVAVVDRVPADVAAVEAVFAADFSGRPLASLPDGADLVWSPGSAAALTSLVGGARSDVAVENEEMSSPPVVSALGSAARSGVAVRVAMTADSSYDAEFARLTSSGVAVRLLADSPSTLYVHAKVVVVDAGRSGAAAFVGSENFSTASLGYNRELGVLITDPALVAQLAATVSSDFTAGSPYRG